MFLLLFQIINIIIFFHPFICCLSYSYQVKMIGNKDKESYSHYRAHDNNKEEKCFHNKKILKSQNIVSFNNLVANSKRRVPKFHFQKWGIERKTTNNSQITAPNRMKEQKRYKIFVVSLSYTLSYPKLLYWYQIQWWSNLETHILQILQCFERAGFITLQVVHLLFFLYIISS